jgi:hypothetical protein
MNRIITHRDNKHDDQPDSFEKGRLFEEYIIRLFNVNSFQIIEWQKSEKIPDGTFSFAHSYPDLELLFLGTRRYRFAVKCKWRKEFREGRINWAKSSQIKSYEDFQNQNRIPVFIAIGIGGEPSDPEKLFVTPICNISGDTDAYEHDLIPYKRKPTHRFFYDTVQRKLF